MHPPTVLVVDDEPHIRRVVHNALAEIGLQVKEAESASIGLDYAAAFQPDLIILDLALPDRSGLSVCLEIRKWSHVPIIVLTASHSEREKVALLDAGADDYVVKPFSPVELQARARAQLRRAALSTRNEAAVVELGDLQIDLARRVVKRAEQEIHLTPTEWDLLRVFVRNAGRTLTHQQIFREVWRNPSGDAQAYLRVHIANLRRKIELDPIRPSFILTEPAVGYRFRAVD